MGITAPIEDVIGGWETAGRLPLDLGVAEGVWGRRHFVEAVGGGLIPAAIAEMKTRTDEDVPARSKLAGALRAIREVLSRLQPGEWTIVADGARTTGEFLLVEVLNIQSIGPNLVFSADATPLDGVFRVVMAGEEHREEIARYLQDLLEGCDHTPSLTSQSARQVTLQGTTDIHVDDEVVFGIGRQNGFDSRRSGSLGTLGMRCHGSLLEHVCRPRNCCSRRGSEAGCGGGCRASQLACLRILGIVVGSLRASAAPDLMCSGRRAIPRLIGRETAGMGSGGSSRR